MVPARDAAGRETALVRGVVEMAVLAILSAEPGHAYAVVERLRWHGFTTAGYGTVYPLVTRLRRQGLLVQESEASPQGPPRNVLHLTPAGREALSAWWAAWRSVSASAESALEATGLSEVAQ